MAQKEIKKEYYNQKPEEEKFNPQWWTAPKGKVHERLIPLTKKLRERQSYRSTQNLKYARLYSSQDTLGLGAKSRNNFTDISGTRLTLNVIKACTDTSSSKIAKAKPRPFFLTEDGDWSVKSRAKKLTQYVETTFDRIGLYAEKGPRAFVDSCVFGTGVNKFFINKDKKQIECVRVIPEELIVDDVDGFYGTPACMYHEVRLARSYLLAMYPKHAAKIQAAESDSAAGDAGGLTYDMIKVTEAWHLPSTSESKDGRKVIAIDNCDLADDEWEDSDFGMVFWRWNYKLTGFWGMGLSEELTGIQVEINKLLRTIQQAQHLAAVPRVYLENSSQVNSQHINNEIGAVVKYSGTPPIIGTANAMPGEVYNHLWSLYAKAFEITGVSMLSATSMKPAGLDSGVALREYQDIESERFQLTAQRNQQAYMDAAKIVIRLTRRLAEWMKEEHGEDLEIKLGCGKYAQNVKWVDIDLDEDQYYMKAYPTSLLPTTPEGKLQKVQELTQAGFFPKDVAFDLLDFPDIESATNRINAPYKIIEMIIEQIIEKGNYIPPEPYMNAQLCADTMQAAYLKAKLDSVPEDKLELMRRFIDDSQTLLALAKQGAMEAAADAAAAQGVATANPEAQPTSDLIPQTGEVPTQPM
jgi:hypothetical protein